MENYQAYKHYYNQDVSYFKQCFPFAPCPTFEEWAEKNRWFTLGSAEALRQMRNLKLSEESATAFIVEAEHNTFQSTAKKTMKRDSSWNNQTGTLINLGKKIFMKLRHINSQVHGWKWKPPLIIMDQKSLWNKVRLN